MAAESRHGNPFGTSRVDSPFQHHEDFTAVYGDEFERLRAILGDIKSDANHQSRCAVVTGHAGTGKTHLMMRLARTTMPANRLFFIRQPNNPDAVMHHIYSRMLESLVEEVPGTGYQQIEYLLAKSFSTIIINAIRAKPKLTRNDDAIMNILQADHLNIFKKIGAANSETKQRNWKYIERKTLAWWSDNYGFGGVALQIVKGLIKFCMYAAPEKRWLVRKWLAGSELERHELDAIGLSSWQSVADKEDFSLEAISVMGRLSIEDEPLIIIFDQLEGLKYSEPLLRRFGECIKELTTQVPNSLFIFNLFPDRWRNLKAFFDEATIERMAQHKIVLAHPSADTLKALLDFKAAACNLDVDSFFSAPELEYILSRPSIRGVLNTASDYFRHKTDGIPLPDASDADDMADDVHRELAALRNDVDALKQYLNIKTPTLGEANTRRSVIRYFRQQQEANRRLYKKDAIISGSDDVGKVRGIMDAFKRAGAGMDFVRLKSRKLKLPDYVMIKNGTGVHVVGFLHESGTAFTNRLKNFNALICQSSEVCSCLLIRDQRMPVIKSRVGCQEIDKLRAFANSRMHFMDQADRVFFETLYGLVTDIDNRDIDVDLATAIETVRTEFKDHWLVQVCGEDVGP
ncbi:MAG: exonuclease [Thermodesulfobacteriota bacterium]|nr:exonuclease [Thermodesulfobacteriota bacterium]